jgi:hypothetical protein
MIRHHCKCKEHTYKLPQNGCNHNIMLFILCEHFSQINNVKVLYIIIVAEFMQLQAVVIRCQHGMGMNTLHQVF